MALIKLNATQGLTGTLPAVSGANLTNIDGGKVLQMITAQDNTVKSRSGEGTVDLVSLAITPSSTSSKILIVGAQNLAAGINDKYMNGTFFRGTTNLGHYQFGISGGSLTVSGGFISANWGASYLDSPSSSSEITYYMKGAAQSVSGGSMFINVNGSHANLTLMEIAG